MQDTLKTHTGADINTHTHTHISACTQTHRLLVLFSYDYLLLVVMPLVSTLLLLCYNMFQGELSSANSMKARRTIDQIKNSYKIELRLTPANTIEIINTYSTFNPVYISALPFIR